MYILTNEDEARVIGIATTHCANAAGALCDFKIEGNGIRHVDGDGYDCDAALLALIVFAKALMR